ncbi:hypothetical protein BC831DRAFT_548212 [Entophlyctis helioformis]|nr:hypothetical protein BC831DRAFT_548212 [Entophlyctis helioformis]
MSGIQSCPIEVWTRIFSFLDPDSSLRVFPLVSKRALSVASSPSAKAMFFLTQYGRSHAIYYAYRKHKRSLDPLVARILLQNGARLPRFVAQRVASDFHMLPQQGGIPTALFVFFINQTYNIYGDQALFKDNDHALFERLVRAPLSEAALSKDRVRALIRDFAFLPVPELCTKPIAENVYFLSRLDLSLVTDLADRDFDLRSVSDNVMERVMLHPYLNTRYLQRYLDAGFVLSDLCIKRTLASGRAHTLAVLHSLIDFVTLQRLAFDTIYDLFGPYLDRQTSLNVPWSSDTVQRLIHSFSIPDSVIAKALLTNPESTCTFDTVHPEFPVTRSYLKTRPYPIWQWILTTYGPHHAFSVACMDDALSRAVADQELHDLHDAYLDAGFVLRPRHVKILACRLLHRNMTSNALHVFRHMREQVLERQLKTSMEDNQPFNEDQLRVQMQTRQISSRSRPSSPDSRPSTPPMQASDSASSPSADQSSEQPSSAAAPFDDINCISEKELIAFRKALAEEIVDNTEWINRMRTIQLEGGPRGGAVRIDRPPDDGLRFLEDARKLLAELRVPPPSVVSKRRNTLPKRRTTMSRSASAAASAIAAAAAASIPSPPTSPVPAARRPSTSSVSRSSSAAGTTGGASSSAATAILVAGPSAATATGTADAESASTSETSESGSGSGSGSGGDGRNSRSWINRMQTWWRARNNNTTGGPSHQHTQSLSIPFNASNMPATPDSSSV